VKKTALHNIFIAAQHCIATSVMPIGTSVLIAQSMKSIHFFTEKVEVDDRLVIGGKKIHGTCTVAQGKGVNQP
jgi:hypothetical protein